MDRLIVSGTSSGSGKTSITCAILKLLTDMGLSVATFKCGCDYIDGTYHSRVTGNTPHNLDSTFCSLDTIEYLLSENSKGADVSIIEGVMGYYDGIGFTTKSSTYEIARTTNTPVVLIVDCHGMGASIGAVLKGYLGYHKDSQVRGVIFNRIAPTLYESASRYAMSLGVTPLGYVPKLKPDCLLQSRHLGLITAEELHDFDSRVARLAEVLSKTIDLRALLNLSKAEPIVPRASVTHLDFHGMRIGVSKDEAFSFLYGDNLDYLRRSNCEIVYFSPLHDASLPERLRGLVLCGGYPEIYARELSSNASMLASVRAAIGNGIPYIAECGGYMYLQKSIGYEGNTYPMVGVFNGETYHTDRLNRFGYVSLTPNHAGTMFQGTLVAHEFHYSDTTDNGTDYRATKLSNGKAWDCVHSGGSYYAGYPHIYYYGNLPQTDTFLRKAEAFKG